MNSTKSHMFYKIALLVLHVICAIALCNAIANANDTFSAWPYTNIDNYCQMSFGEAYSFFKTMPPREAIQKAISISACAHQDKNPATMRQYINVAEKIAEEHNLRREEGEIWLFRAKMCIVGNDFRGALQMTSSAISISKKYRHYDLLITALDLRAAILLQQKKKHECIEIYKEIYSIAVQTTNHLIQAEAIYQINNIRYDVDFNQVDESDLEKARQMFDALKLPAGSANCLKLRGNCEKRRRNYNQALQFYDSAQKKFYEVNDLHGFADCSYNKGLIYIDLERYDKAITSYRESIVCYTQIGALQATGLTHMKLGRIHYFKKDYAVAEYAFTMAQDILNQCNDMENYGKLCGYWADLYLAMGYTNDALTACEEAISIYKQLGNNEMVYEHNVQFLKIKSKPSQRE